ncbi:FG-GAP-like repeat-containing protein [Kitasatospora sp. NPDC003701]
MIRKGIRPGWKAGLIASAVTAGALTVSSGAPAGAVVGDPTADGAYGFTVRLDIGSTARGCTGALVDRLWVITAASCFADDPAQPTALAAGAPKWKTTATVGRSDLTTTAGQVSQVVELVPRQDRDLVMARLATPVYGVTPLAVATTAPVGAESLRVPGFGRSADEWSPAKLRSGVFTVDSVKATSLATTGVNGAAVCKGDTGAPAVREKNGKAELVAVSSLSWQGGCFGTPATETRTGAVSSRTDDLAGWIRQLTDRRSAAVNEVGTGRLRWADFDGDGRPDYLTIEDDGSVTAWLNHGGDPVSNTGWQGLGKIATGITTDRSRVRFADFDGDGRADYLVINSDGSVSAWLNRGGDPAGGAGWQGIGKIATGITNRQDQVRFADFDGDGRSDYLLVADDGSVSAWLNRGGDPAGGAGWQGAGKIATGITTDRSRVRFADFDGDGRADYLLFDADGSISAWLNRGGDPAGGAGWQGIGKIATGMTANRDGVFLTDFDADGKADYLWNPGDGTTDAAVNKGGDGHGGWAMLGRVASGA